MKKICLTFRGGSIGTAPGGSPTFSQISTPSLLLFKISGSAPGFAFKKKPPTKVSIYQVRKRFFFIETSFHKLVYINSVSFNQSGIAEWYTIEHLKFKEFLELKKMLSLLRSFLRSDRKSSELGLPLITKAGSGPVQPLNKDVIKEFLNAFINTLVGMHSSTKFS